MLIVEDYSESTKYQTLLKKVGLDIFPLSNPNRLSNQILTFNPDIIVAWGSQKFSSMQVGQKLKEQNHLRAKVILILPSGERPPVQELAKTKMDLLMEEPLQVDGFLHVLEKLLALEPQSLSEKYKKTFAHENQSEVGPSTSKNSLENIDAALESVLIRGGGIHSQHIKLEDKERVARYQKFVEGLKIDKEKTSHTRQAIKARQAELKKGWDFEFLEELDKLKRAFAAALFDKK